MLWPASLLLHLQCCGRDPTTVDVDPSTSTPPHYGTTRSVWIRGFQPHPMPTPSALHNRIAALSAIATHPTSFTALVLRTLPPSRSSATGVTIYTTWISLVRERRRQWWRCWARRPSSRCGEFLPICRDSLPGQARRCGPPFRASLSCEAMPMPGSRWIQMCPGGNAHWRDARWWPLRLWRMMRKVWWARRACWLIATFPPMWGMNLACTLCKIPPFLP